MCNLDLPDCRESLQKRFSSIIPPGIVYHSCSILQETSLGPPTPTMEVGSGVSNRVNNYLGYDLGKVGTRIAQWFAGRDLATSV